jgi:hypothetical protein
MTDIILAAITALFVLLLVTTEALGSSLARRLRKDGTERKVEQDRTGHVLTSTFGLLALLMGFSFGITLDRYDTRRADVIAEANAIGTAHYRAGFLLPQGEDLRRALEEYAAARAAYGRAGENERAGLESEAARLRGAIAAASHAIAPSANTPLGALVVASVTDVLDIGVQREANLRAKLPWTVFVVLVGLSLVGAATMGFAYPLDGVLRQGSSLSLFVLLALTVVVIVDLDRPAGGGVVIDQRPMVELVAELVGGTGSAAPPSGQALPR